MGAPTQHEPRIGGTFLFLLWIWAVLDVFATDNILIRNLPKTTWLILVLVVPSIGAVVWILLGRPEGAGFSLGGGEGSRARPPGGRPGREAGG